MLQHRLIDQCRCQQLRSKRMLASACLPALTSRCVDEMHLKLLGQTHASVLRHLLRCSTLCPLSQMHGEPCQAVRRHWSSICIVSLRYHCCPTCLQQQCSPARHFLAAEYTRETRSHLLCKAHEQNEIRVSNCLQRELPNKELPAILILPNHL